MGVSSPQDCSVAGFDNGPGRMRLTPKLTTIHIDKEVLGRRSVTALLPAGTPIRKREPMKGSIGSIPLAPLPIIPSK